MTRAKGGSLAVKAAIAELRAGFVDQRSAARAQHEKKYLKSDLAFIGVTQPVIRKAARAFVRAHRDLGHDELVALVEGLWATRTHELRSVAIGILELSVAKLGADDAAWLIDLVDRSNTWAHVDWLAVKVVGGLLAQKPALTKLLDRWAKHENFWVRRTALLALHDPLLAGKGDADHHFTHFSRLAAGMLHEREFFIRKAIGWVLRSTAKRTPALTVAFVEAHAAALSGLSFREATRVLPAAEQERLVALRARGATTRGGRKAPAAPRSLY